MKKLLFLFVALSFVLIGCNAKTDKKKNLSNESITEFKYPEIPKSYTSVNSNINENSIIFSDEDNAPEVISYIIIIRIIRNDYGQLTRFVNYPQNVEETSIK